MVKAREGIMAKYWLCHVYCRGWKAAQGPQEGQTEKGALSVGHGATVGVLILAQATLFLIKVAQTKY